MSMNFIALLFSMFYCRTHMTHDFHQLHKLEWGLETSFEFNTIFSNQSHANRIKSLYSNIVILSSLENRPVLIGIHSNMGIMYITVSIKIELNIQISNTGLRHLDFGFCLMLIRAVTIMVEIIFDHHYYKSNSM